MTAKKYLQEQCNGLGNQNLKFSISTMYWKAMKQSTATGAPQVPNHASLINTKKGKTRFKSYQQEVQQQPMYEDIGYHFTYTFTTSCAVTICNWYQLKTIFTGACTKTH
ncbi:hypothetical protein CsSME_00014321 [Camellia sinensis var. sinensis]